MGFHNTCLVCKKKCGTGLGLGDRICLFCNEKIHKDCMSLCRSDCDLGSLRRLIIPPTCVIPIDNSVNQPSEHRGKSKVIGSEYRHGTYKIETGPETAPLVVFVNPLSGDTRGSKLITMFQRFLNPIQVFDLSEEGPHRG